MGLLGGLVTETDGEKGCTLIMMIHPLANQLFLIAWYAPKSWKPARIPLRFQPSHFMSALTLEFKIV